MLDKRMIELADWWVLVKRRGVAQPFRINVNDFQPHRLPQRKPLPGDEHIQFVDLPDSDPDKEYLDTLKDEIIRSEGPRTIYLKEHEEKLDKAVEEAERETRDELLEDVFRQTSASKSELSNAIDLSQQAISKKLKGVEPDVEKNRAKTVRNQAIRSLDAHTDLNRSEIGDIQWIDLAPSTVGRIVNGA
jgi:hypothetical protein